ncbi:DUF202 domain-containing protein [Streptomyces sp. RB6PN25]|uniref:DUF202 domain-containing protein n=1 Tax=Streptomyces humicola TaxID=2953240 RepID=A0ABT1PYP1_9ACTN|nr:DUF202 domain-containing protein [Streptomyces humicola]MCQ4082804.1 DUF202 domain-containing protein [Streptomyces humicola]
MRHSRRPGRRGVRALEPRGPAVEEGTEPDPRFTFANERTFLAWCRTALALVAAGLAITQLLPPFAGTPWGRRAIGVPLIALGALVAAVGYVDWGRNQHALRLGRPLPRTVLPLILTLVVAAECVLAAVLVLSSGRAAR